MASEASELVIAVSRAVESRSDELSGVVRALLLIDTSPMALTLVGLREFAHPLACIGGWELALLLADDEARAAWDRAVARLLEDRPVLEGWGLIGEIDGAAKVAGNFIKIDLRHGFAAGLGSAIRLGRQMERP